MRTLTQLADGKNFGQRIQALASSKNKSISAFSRECGICRTAIYSWLNPKVCKGPQLETAIKIQKTYGLSDVDFLELCGLKLQPIKQNQNNQSNK